jgi:outer membrane protein assembly factor BamB
VANTDDYGTQIFAIDAATGVTKWSHAISGTYFWSNAAYDHGQVFVVNFDGLVSAFRAASGSLNWSAQMPGQRAFSSPPTAKKGMLYLAGAGEGGTLYAVDEKNGDVLWTDEVANGDNSSPAIGAGRVYVSYPCQYYGFNRKTGALDWNDNEGCDGGGGKTPVYFGKQVYVRDGGGLILDAKNGAQRGTFQSTPAPAFMTVDTNAYRFTLSSSTLNCTDVTSGQSLWNFAGDGHLSTAPITIDKYVIEGSTSGNLYVLDGKSGKVVSTTKVGASIPAPDEQDVSEPLTGLGAADGEMIVPAGSQLIALVPE